MKSAGAPLQLLRFCRGLRGNIPSIDIINNVPPLSLKTQIIEPGSKERRLHHNARGSAPIAPGYAIRKGRFRQRIAGPRSFPRSSASQNEETRQSYLDLISTWFSYTSLAIASPRNTFHLTSLLPNSTSCCHISSSSSIIIPALSQKQKHRPCRTQIPSSKDGWAWIRPPPKGKWSGSSFLTRRLGRRRMSRSKSRIAASVAVTSTL